MSFYGNITRINSSPYIFDKYYPNRAAMEASMEKDNIYIGRYVLVKYTCKFVDAEHPEKSAVVDFDKYDNTQEPIYVKIKLTAENYKPNTYYIKNGNTYSISESTTFDANTDYYIINRIVSAEYKVNVLADITKYKDTYDATVWQKVYTATNAEGQPKEKYILVAELNAAVPRLDFNVINPKYLDDLGNEYWYEPTVSQEASTEDAYSFSIPDMLHLNVGEMNKDFYAKDLINPAYRYEMKTGGKSTKHLDATGTIISHDDMLAPEHNYMQWTNYLNSSEVLQGPSDIDEKKLDTLLYAFGQLISDLYDALYGKPESGTGPRPFYANEDDIENLLAKYDKGLIGILSSIGSDFKGDGSEDLYSRRLQPGMYYYFTSRWNDATEDPDNFIENIPEVIGSKAGGSAEAHYWLDFNNNDNTEYFSTDFTTT